MLFIKHNISVYYTTSYHKLSLVIDMSFEEYKKYAEDVLNVKQHAFSSVLMMVPVGKSGHVAEPPAKGLPTMPDEADNIISQKTPELKRLYKKACLSCLSDELYRERFSGVYCKACRNGKGRVVAHMKRTAEDRYHKLFLVRNNVEQSKKKCKTCPSDKDIGASGYCKECKRQDNNVRYNLKRNTPLPVDGKCHICKKIPNKTLNLDHDHIKKTARGWICFHCNILIGFIETNNVTRHKIGAYFDYLDRNA